MFLSERLFFAMTQGIIEAQPECGVWRGRAECRHSIILWGDETCIFIFRNSNAMLWLSGFLREKKVKFVG